MKKIQSIAPVPLEHFDQHMQALVEHGVSPRLVVTVVQGGEAAFAAGYGWSDLGRGTAATGETVYNMLVSAPANAAGAIDSTRKHLGRGERI
jgi:CubicO group peptidase (beta-lactamase class C family)